MTTTGEDEESFSIPPPIPPAELPEKVQFVTSGEADARLAIPPPQKAELPKKVQLTTAGEADPLNIPPPELWSVLYSPSAAQIADWTDHTGADKW